ncbi:MAG TPA: AraC family transcriptional regulator [Rhodocyclaceae bacterium]|nr:AraC family transcriptional regulator [Rhodocyclaceae bacterium]
MEAGFSIRGKRFQTHMEIPLGWRRESADLPSLIVSPYFAICLVRSGSAVLVFDRQAVPVASPSIIILDELTRPTFRNARGLQLTTLYFHPSYINSTFSMDALHAEPHAKQLTGTTKQDYFLLERFVKLTGEERVFDLPPHLADAVANLLDTTIAQADQQPDKFWPCRTRSFLIELLFQLRQLQAVPVPATQVFGTTNDVQAIRISQALSYVQERYQQDFTLGDLARACATNRTTLNSEFRMATGMTVRAYTIALRMKMAATLLRDTRIPVAEVMSRVGYENQSHFTRAFRLTLGETPRTYRDNHCIL